ncbi:MAG: hypothetical protein AAGD96_21855, partial [Chloroflexota bacterium]
MPQNQDERRLINKITTYLRKGSGNIYSTVAITGLLYTIAGGDLANLGAQISQISPALVWITPIVVRFMEATGGDLLAGMIDRMREASDDEAALEKV